MLCKISEDRIAGVTTALPSDLTSRLGRLAKLHCDGVITEEEFAEKKRALLDEM